MSTDWPEIESGDDWDSQCEFWSAVLSFGAAEGCSALQFSPRFDENSLKLEFENEDGFYVRLMEPPPAECREALFRTGQQLVAGRGPWGRVRLLFARMRSIPVRGTVTRGNAEWKASCFGGTLRFTRQATA